MAKGSTDQFVNQAVITCTESAANTLTFKKLETGISLFEKVAWIISRIEYFISGISNLNSSGDSLTMAITSTDQITGLALTNAAVIDLLYYLRIDYGTAANEVPIAMPFTKDLSTFSGGGLIVPPNPLYLGVVGSGEAAASTVTAKFFYRTLELSPDQYWELVESRRIISSS